MLHMLAYHPPGELHAQTFFGRAVASFKCRDRDGQLPMPQEPALQSAVNNAIQQLKKDL